MKSKSSQNRFMRIISIPIRALGKARDMYVRGMTNYADTGSCYGGRIMGLPPHNYGVSLPRSFTSTSSRSNDSEDFRELLRVASTRTLAQSSNYSNSSSDLNLYFKEEMMLRRKQPPRGTSGGGFQKKMPLRSFSVGMGRIDEDKPCCAFAEEEEEEEEEGEEKEDYRQKRNQRLAYPRSKSYAMNNNSSSSSRTLAF